MLTGLYPVVMTSDVAATASFFRDSFDLETVFESEWYVSLKRDAWELAVLDSSHATIPEGYRTPATGILINIEVDDVDRKYERLVRGAGHAVALDIRSEAFGQRHFILVAPGGILVDVIQVIPYSGEFADS